MTAISPLHLYVHIPYCRHKCPYCDFNSHVRRGVPWERYLSALMRELDGHATRSAFVDRPLTSIYFGGGTPSLMPPPLFARFLAHVRDCFALAPDIEISMEANPGAMEHASLAAYRAAGINRLSVGVQSFSDAELRWLERIHSAADAADTLRHARAAGFDNVSLDLMYGLPGQSPASWAASLEQAIRHAPEHISCYQLSVEPDTSLARRHALSALALPDEDTAIRLFDMTRSRLAEAGYAAYEISNFARPGRICRHNDGYWSYHDYIGFGAGACGKRDMPDGGILRYVNRRSPERYMRAVDQGGPAQDFEETLGLERAAAEAVWLGLRRNDGVSRPWFRARFGRDVCRMFGPALALWTQRGCIDINSGALRLSAQGRMLADTIAADVLSGCGDEDGQSNGQKAAAN